jgi:PLP dependent protein
MNIRENLNVILRQIPEQVKLVVVTKSHQVDTIRMVYDAGYKVFGENRAQELISKQPLLPSDVEWHFIGHLQRNKVKHIAPFVQMIHSVDGYSLLREINRQAGLHNRVIDCLLQFHIAEEETKFGLSSAEARELLESATKDHLQHVRIVGVMGMATFTDDSEQVRKEFSFLRSLFEEFRTEFFREASFFKEISMGMSGDYSIAIEEGSTMVRIGSAIFSG